MKLFVVEVERKLIYRMKCIVACEHKQDVTGLLDEWTAPMEFYEQAEDDDCLEETKQKVLNVAPLTKENMPKGWSGECIPFSPEEVEDTIEQLLTP